MVSHGSIGRPARNVFVGRENEILVLRAAWQAATHGSAQVIAIEGSPGIGKSALIEALLADVTAPVIRVTGVQADSLTPWSVLDEIMARLPATRPTPSQGIPVAALAHQRTRPPRRDPQASPGFVGQGLTEALQVGGELALLVDDAQWADRASMAALQYAARRLRDDPVLLILAYRHHGDDSLPEYMTVSPGLSKAWRQIFDAPKATLLPLAAILT